MSLAIGQLIMLTRHLTQPPITAEKINKTFLPLHSDSLFPKIKQRKRKKSSSPFPQRQTRASDRTPLTSVQPLYCREITAAPPIVTPPTHPPSAFVFLTQILPPPQKHIIFFNATTQNLFSDLLSISHHNHRRNRSR